MIKAITILLIFSLTLFAENGDLLSRIVEKYDNLYRSSSSKGTMEMFIKTPQWEREIALQVWTRDLSHTLIKILSPARDRGTGTLKIENRMWNYLPRTDRVLLVPPSMMMASWMGSDFTNDDLMREYTLAEDYILSIINEKEDRIYVEAIPREGRHIIWARAVMVFDANTLQPLKLLSYDERDRLSRTMVYSNVRDFGGRMVPSQIEIFPERKEGHMTRVRYLTLSFDEPIDENLFTMEKLREPIRGN